MCLYNIKKINNNLPQTTKKQKLYIFKQEDVTDSTKQLK